jgi:subtilisin family serine protease
MAKIGASRRIVFPALLLAASLPLAAADVYRQAAWRDKVEPRVLSQLDDSRAAEFILYLGEQADLSGAAEIHGKARKGRFVFERLVATARATQGGVLEELRRRGVEHRAYWAANAIWVRGDRKTLESVAARPEIARVLANPRVEYERPLREFIAKRADAELWHLADVRVREVFWENGIRGQGAVVAGQDTGYDWEHPALRSRYRGVDGNKVDHDYNWHDAIHSGGGSCGTDSPEPCDDDDHGTHTMGTMVGETPDNEFGLAPEAKWIACRNMDQGVGTPATYTECTQWLIAPTDSNGDNPDPGKAPDVINNSWGCPPGEGCGDPAILRQIVENVRAAGILFVVSAGNSGPDCGSISSPPAIYDAAFTVAATGPEGMIADFSSRGPVTVDGSGRAKPDIAAPGVRVFSSTRDNNYALLQGTSMASPHVAGMAALVVSAGRCLRGDVDGIERHLLAHAAPHKDPAECGGTSGSEVPNPIFGAGDLRAAMPDCPGSIHGAADGLKGTKVVCADRTGGGKVSNKFVGSTGWSCDGATFTPEPGDKVQIRLIGKAKNAALLGGAALEVDLQRVTCKNQKTRQSVKAALLGNGEWDCAAAGLEAGKNDKILQTLVGRAQ